MLANEGLGEGFYFLYLGAIIGFVILILGIILIVICGTIFHIPWK
jgi:hypothetical protein